MLGGGRGRLTLPHTSLPSRTESSVSGGNVTRMSFLHAQFYKKTKQLPVLLKCCEEIQPHQWKPPVEREEHRLPFWLKVQPSSSRCVGSRRTLALPETSGVTLHARGHSCRTGLSRPSSFPLPLLLLPLSPRDCTTFEK